MRHPSFVNAVSLAVSFRQDICGGLCLIFLLALYLTKSPPEFLLFVIVSQGP
jgi:hypothetical protein